MDFDQLERPVVLFVAPMRSIDRGMNRLHQRRLPHAACAPEQRVVGGQSARESFGIFEQHIAYAIDALEQRHLDAIHSRDRNEPVPVGVPRERVRRGKLRRSRSRRRQPFERGRDALERAGGTRGFGRYPQARGGGGRTLSGAFGHGMRQGCVAPLPGRRQARKITDLERPSRPCSGAKQHCNWAAGGYSPRRFCRPNTVAAPPSRGLNPQRTQRCL
jgi:hypothetical protein